jgi:hypothetical protein
MTVRNTSSPIWYYSLYKEGHIECMRVSEELMKCPTNAPNLPTSYDKETARDLATWDLNKGCNEISENVHLCKE